MPESGPTAPSEPMKRRLAAIMFADMVGFTALVQEDEHRAQLLRDRYRQVLVSRVMGHGGLVHQYYGDGALSTFDSAVEAVLCSVEIQLELAREPAVPVRVGVHTGDIVLDADGVYGDGVNVAARVERLCVPGGVLVSGKVFDEVKNHASITAVPLGPARLRNVAHPVRLFAIANGGLPVPSREAVGAQVVDGAGRGGAAAGPDGEAGGHALGAGEAFLRAVKERSLVAWAVAYLGAAGTVLVAARFSADLLGWGGVAIRRVDLLAFVGFLVTLVVAWNHGLRGRQPVRRGEVLVVGTLLLAGLGAMSFLAHGDADVAPPTRGMALPSGAGARVPVAVLPFDDHSPDPGDAYFAHGVQEDITTALSRIRTLRVPGRISVERYRTERPGNGEIAAALGVDYVVEGSALVVGSNVRITVALVDLRSNERLWSEQYDRAFTVDQLTAVQAEIAREVAERLEAMVTPEDSARMLALPTRRSDAWVLWQKARYRWDLRTEPDVREARSLFQAAIDLDPTFAAAYAGLADAFLVLANWGWMDHRIAYPSGMAAARTALELDSLAAGTRASIGALHLWSSHDWAAAEGHFRRAIELDPEHSYAHSWYSSLLSVLGRHEEATAEATLAWRIDPLAPQIAYALVRSYFLARNYGRALQEARRALQLHPAYGNLHSILCSTLVAAGSLDEAEEACGRTGTAGDGDHRFDVAILRAHQGRREEALAGLERVRRARADGRSQPVLEAMVHAALGDRDEALTLLREAVEEGYPHVEYLSNHPFFDGLRSDSRYAELLARLALPGPDRAGGSGGRGLGRPRAGAGAGGAEAGGG